MKHSKTLENTRRDEIEKLKEFNQTLDKIFDAGNKSEQKPTLARFFRLRT